MENMADVFYSPACFLVAFGGAADPVQNPPCRFLSGGVLSAESGDGCFGVLFAALFDWQTGSVNSILQSLGFIEEKVNWMGSPAFAQGITSFIQWWMWFGYSSILLTAGITAISQEIIDASVVDGASNSQRLFRITLPLLKPTMLYVLVTSLIGGMQIFDIPMTLTKGDGEPQKSLMTMVLYLYNMAFKNKDYSYGATISYGLFIIILLFSILFFKVLYGKKEEA